LNACGTVGSVLVPTMGALHDGHATLVRAGARERDASHPGRLVVVSVFVNPTQFNDRSDLARYPRTLDADVALCREAGADAVFAPDEATIYPPDGTVRVPPLPAVATRPGLEDAFRPGHFAGVCQVVARLFDLVRPGAAMFGEKDWQQLQVVRAMVASDAGTGGIGGVGAPVVRPRIVGVPTVREPDGLAMSSRNVFLSGPERTAATAISRALREAGGLESVADAEQRMRSVLDAAGLRTEYAAVRLAETLMPVSGLAGTAETMPMRALIAARLGAVRLIDNARWPGGW
jgi:pantoate--beta-alanine ligase